MFNSKFKLLAVCILLFTVSFGIRAFVWYEDLAYKMGWAYYDAGYYASSGVKIINSYLTLNFSDVDLFHPTFIRLLIGLSYLTALSIFPDNPVHAALLFPILVSSVITPVVFLLGREIIGEKAGIAASIIYALDPYSIRFSVIFLDIPMVLFIFLSFYFLYRFKNSNSTAKWFVVFAAVSAGLAVSSKHLALPILLLLIILMRIPLRHSLVFIAVMAAVYGVLNPSLWYYSAASTVVNKQGEALGIPAVIASPIAVGNLMTFPWFILTYLGLFDTGPSSVPFIARFMLLIGLIYSIYVLRRFNMDTSLIYFFAASLIPLILLPRQYWVMMGSEGFYPLKDSLLVEGETPIFMRTIFPYYYVPMVLPTVLTASQLLFNNRRNVVKIHKDETRVFFLISIVVLVCFALLSPISIFSNNLFIHYWDVLFVAILSIGINDSLTSIGFAALYFLLAVLIILVVVGGFTTYRIYTLTWRNRKEN